MDYKDTQEELKEWRDTVEFEPVSKNPRDIQVGGKHYVMPIQPIDFIMENGLGFCEGNIIKYVSRHRNKNGKEDLLKARHYIDFLLDEYTRMENK